MNLTELRKELDATGFDSLTTNIWQQDMEKYIRERHSDGNVIIELGMGHGGMTCQLAYLAAELGFTLYSIDILQSAIDHAKAGLEKYNYFGVKDKINFYKGTFKGFVDASSGLNDTVMLCIIDGNHSFEWTVRDISAMFLLKNIPKGVFFHDFHQRQFCREESMSIEGEYSGTWAVDLAVKYMFGNDVKLNRIGAIHNQPHVNKFTINLTINPGERFYDEECWEGCYIRPIPPPQYMHYCGWNKFMEIRRRMHTGGKIKKV